MSFRVGATLGSWSRALRAYVADHSGDMEIVLVRDQRAATTSGLSVVCVDPSTVWVSAGLVAELVEAGVVVVGMFADQADADRWVAWGVEHRLSLDTAPEHMAFLLASLRPATLTPSPTVDTTMSHSAAGVSGGVGSLVVVGGPSGSGAREVAVGLADRWSVSGSTVVVDCAETGGTVAARVGLGEHPNVLGALRAVDTGAEVADVVAAPVPGGRLVPFEVIAGLPSAAEWPQMSSAGVQRLLGVCVQRWSTVVAVTGPVVEDLRRWVDRYGVSRDLLATAPVVVGVCAASPNGVLAFASWLSAVRPQAVVQVIVNKVPAGSPFVRGEVFDRLRSLCGDRVELVGALPWDRRVTHAEWNGELVRRGRFARAVHQTADRLMNDMAVEVVGSR